MNQIKLMNNLNLSFIKFRMYHLNVVKIQSTLDTDGSSSSIIVVM